MQKWLVLLASAILVTGCTATAEPAKVTPTAESTTQAMTAEDAFVQDFRNANVDADRGTDEQWLELGESICEALSAGASPNDIIDQMQGTSVDAAEAASALLLATDHLCPERAPQ